MRSAEPAAGEIPLLDADRIDDHRGASTSGDMLDAVENSYGEGADEQAIARLVKRLRHTPAGEKLSEEDIEDKAISLYNRSIEQIMDKMRSGDFVDEQIARSAGVFGERPDELKQRLLDRIEQETAAAS